MMSKIKNGNNLKIQQISGNSTRSTFKRNRSEGETNSGTTTTEDMYLEATEKEFTTVGSDGKHREKTRGTNGNFGGADSGPEKNIARLLTFVNTARSRDRKEGKQIDSDRARYEPDNWTIPAQEDQIRVSNQSIKYATATHLHPIVIDCNPKLRFTSTDEKKTS